MVKDIIPNNYTVLLNDIKQRIRSAQYEALKAVNKELISLYWDIGRMIIERQKGGSWGKSVVEQLAQDLQAEFPGISGFSAQNLWRMKQFYQSYAMNTKLSPMVREIGWTHNIIILMNCKEDLEREFYIRMTRKFGWTKNVLTLQIENKSYEKTLLNQTNFDKTVPERIRSQAKLAVKDEYTFDFLELGEEYFIDLLLYHRALKCLVAIELKIGKFIPEYVGKMQFYLAVLDDKIRMEDEKPSIGIILCKSKDKTIVEYALRESNKAIGVAAYRMVTTLPEELRGQLPEPEQIAKLLEEVD